MRATLAIVFGISVVLLLVLVLAANRAPRQGARESEMPRAVVALLRVLAGVAFFSGVGWLILYASGR